MKIIIRKEQLGWEGNEGKRLQIRGSVPSPSIAITIAIAATTTPPSLIPFREPSKLNKAAGTLAS